VYECMCLINGKNEQGLLQLVQVLGFFSAKTSQIKSAFILQANTLRDEYLFGQTSNPALFEKYGIEEGSDSIVAFKTYDDKMTPYTGKPSSALVGAFITAQSLPLVGEYTEETRGAYNKRGLPLAKFFTKFDSSPDNAKHLKYYVTRLKKMARLYSNRILFVTMYVPAPAVAKEMEELGVVDKDNFLVLHNGKQKFHYTSTFR